MPFAQTPHHTMPSEPPPYILRLFHKLHLSLPRLLFFFDTVWNTLLTRYLLLHPFPVLRSATHVRPITYASAELAQMQGALRVSLLCLSLWGLVERSDRVRKPVALVLGVTSAVTSYVYVMVLQKGRWNARIMVPLLLVEAAFACANTLYYIRSHKEV